MIRPPRVSGSLEIEMRVRTSTPWHGSGALPRPTTLAALALGVLAACGNPDNQVVGGLLGAGSVPNAVITNVGSAISAPVNATDLRGNQLPRNAVILTDREDLCTKLAQYPDYLRAPIEPFVAVVLVTPQRQVGTYYLGQTDIGALLLTTSGVGQTVYGFPGASGGTIGIGQLDSSHGGRAEGNFAMQVYDPSVQASSLYTVYGQFKTAECPALETAYVPIFQ
jgi:hypothetical protein